MPRAKLSDVSLKQLVAELNRRKSRLADLLVQREAISKEIQELELFFQGSYITDASLGELGASVSARAPAKRRGRPPGKRGSKPAAKWATGKTLAEYVKETLGAATKGLSVSEIEKRILASDYPTKAKRLYKQIMMVVGKGGFKKVERGVYALAGVAKQAGEAAVKAAAKAVARVPAKGKGKRGVFPETGEEFILGLTKGKGATTSEINQKWAASGRKGKADVTLARMAKAGKLKKVKEGRGSRYTAAPAPF